MEGHVFLLFSTRTQALSSYESYHLTCHFVVVLHLHMRIQQILFDISFLDILFLILKFKDLPPSFFFRHIYEKEHP